MKVLTKGEILGANDIKKEFVPVPEWSNGEEAGVYVRVMSGTAKAKFESDNVSVKFEGKKTKVEAHTRDAAVRLAALTICDEAGTLLFSEGDIAALGAKSGVVLERIIKVANRLNGTADEALEEEVGNSSSAPSGSSTTD